MQVHGFSQMKIHAPNDTVDTQANDLIKDDDASFEHREEERRF